MEIVVEFSVKKPAPPKRMFRYSDDEMKRLLTGREMNGSHTIGASTVDSDRVSLFSGTQVCLVRSSGHV